MTQSVVMFGTAPQYQNQSNIDTSVRSNINECKFVLTVSLSHFTIIVYR